MIPSVEYRLRPWLLSCLWLWTNLEEVCGQTGLQNAYQKGIDGTFSPRRRLRDIFQTGSRHHMPRSVPWSGRSGPTDGLKWAVLSPRLLFLSPCPFHVFLERRVRTSQGGICHNNWLVLEGTSTRWHPVVLEHSAWLWPCLWWLQTFSRNLVPQIYIWLMTSWRNTCPVRVSGLLAPAEQALSHGFVDALPLSCRTPRYRQCRHKLLAGPAGCSPLCIETWTVLMLCFTRQRGKHVLNPWRRIFVNPCCLIHGSLIIAT